MRYSISSMSSLPYEDSPSHHSFHQADYLRPGSSHHRPISPLLIRHRIIVITKLITCVRTRITITPFRLRSCPPPSSKQPYNLSTLNIRHLRRHSQAMSPYPSPYGEHPSSGNHATDMQHSIDSYGFPAGHAEFASLGCTLPQVRHRSVWLLIRHPLKQTRCRSEMHTGQGNLRYRARTGDCHFMIFPP